MKMSTTAPFATEIKQLLDEGKTIRQVANELNLKREQVEGFVYRTRHWKSNSPYARQRTESEARAKIWLMKHNFSVRQGKPNDSFDFIAVRNGIQYAVNVKCVGGIQYTLSLLQVRRMQKSGTPVLLFLHEDEWLWFELRNSAELKVRRS